MTVWKILRHEGVPLRSAKRRLSPDEKHSIAERYVTGEDAYSIARDMQMWPQRIYSILAEMGVARRPPSDAGRIYSLDQSAFDSAESSEEAAYFVGLLMADGSVKRHRDALEIELGLQWRDREIIARFAHFLKTDSPIRKYTPTKANKPINGKPVKAGPSARLCVYSARLVTALARYGVVPQKSTRETVSVLENNRHFWRGMVDGDGWICYTYGRDPVIGLTGSLRIVEQFLAFSRTVVSHGVNVQPNGSIWKAVIGYAAGYRIIKHLYADCSVSLACKQAKADKILRECQRFETWEGFRDWSAVTKEEVLRLYAMTGTWRGVAKTLGMPEPSLQHVRRRLGLTPKRIRARR